MATYTSAASGLWSAGATWVGGVKPPSGAGHKIVIASSHTVTYDEAAGEYGDDTSSATAASNAIVINGVLKASRSTSTSLTCRGTLAQANNSTLDWGTLIDPIPAGITAELVLNYSTALAAGKHALTAFLVSGFTTKMKGVTRTRNTALSSATSAGATSISVVASLNWSVGDVLVIGSDTNDPSRAQKVTITGGSAPNWNVSAVTNAREEGTKVGNLTSNVVVRSHTVASPANLVLRAADTDTTAVIDISDVESRDLGSSGGWAQAGRGGYFGFSTGGPSCGRISVTRLACHGTTTNAVNGIASAYASINRHLYDDCAVYMLAGNAHNCGDGANVELRGIRIYSCATAFVGSYEAGAGSLLLTDPYVRASSQIYSLGQAFDVETNGGDARSLNRIASLSAVSSFVVNDAGLNATARGFVSGSYGAGYRATFNRCQYAGNTLSGDFSTIPPSVRSRVIHTSINGNTTDNRDQSYFRLCFTDTTTRKRSTYAVKIQPKVANTAITYTFTVPAVAGVQQTIKGSLRFDATYGTATPPRIDLSGQGVTQTKTCAAVADAWDDFTFTFTPTSTGDITATVTVQSASTAGFAWLDGIYHYPMTQSVRHYGYQFLAQAALIANDKLAVTNEATVLAYPVAVNHGTGVITITGNVTATQIGDYLEADLCQTANQAQAVHYTLGVGGAFTTSYNVVANTGCTITGEFTTSGDVTLTGTGDVDGVYTDSVGRHVKILAPNLIAGTWVYLYNVTDDALISKVQLSGAGLSLPIVYAADKTVEYRFGYSDATTRKYLIRGTGVLSSSGLQVIDSQVDDPVYAAIAGDPATFTEFAPDFPNLQVDAEETFLVPRMYKWLMWAEASSDGIELMAGAVSSDDGTNVRINVDVVDAMIQNPNAGTNIFARGGYLYRSDGTGWIVPGPGIITPDFGRAYVASGSGIAADVWAAPTRTLTGPEPLVLDNGEQLLTVNTSTGVPKYLARG